MAESTIFKITVTPEGAAPLEGEAAEFCLEKAVEAVETNLPDSLTPCEVTGAIHDPRRSEPEG